MFNRISVSAGLTLALMSQGGNAALSSATDNTHTPTWSDSYQVSQVTPDQMRRSMEDNAAMRRSLVEMLTEVESVRGEMARLRGQIEVDGKNINDLQRRQKDLATALGSDKSSEQIKGLDERLRRLEPVKVSVDRKEFMAEPAEKREFDAALAILRTSDFKGAESSFSSFLQRYPDSGYKPSALFWLGNAQYANRDYKDAIVNFSTLVKVAPDHLRAPDALLSVANCQAELKDTAAQRQVLDQLVRSYPQTDAAQTARDRLSRLQ